MQCRICGSSRIAKTLQGRDVWTSTPERHKYLECADCKCIQIAEYPDDISRYYGDSYYSFNVSTSGKGKIKKCLISRRDSFGITQQGFKGRFLFKKYPTKQFSSVSLPNIPKNSTILDVGCGDGSLIRSLAEHGYRHLLGIDPFTKVEVNGNGFEIRKCDIFDIDRKFDFIVMKGTLEHQTNQTTLLKTTHRLLNAGGRCIIRIPIVDSYAYEEYGTDWVQFDGPRHLYLHSKKSMKVLAERAGFKIINLWDDSELLQIVGSEQLKKNVYLGDPNSIVSGSSQSLFNSHELRRFRKTFLKVQKERRGDTYLFDLQKNE